MECVPAVRADVDRVATPAVRVPVPSAVTPSLKVTVPPGVPVAVVLTVAVKVTDCPKLDGFNDDVTVVEVASLFTTWLNAPEVLPVNVASPP